MDHFLTLTHAHPFPAIALRQCVNISGPLSGIDQAEQRTFALTLSMTTRCPSPPAGTCLGRRCLCHLHRRAADFVHRGYDKRTPLGSVDQS